MNYMTLSITDKEMFINMLAASSLLPTIS